MLMETIDDGHALLGTEVAEWPVETCFSIVPYPDFDHVGSWFVPPPHADFQCVSHKHTFCVCVGINEKRGKMFHLDENFSLFIYIYNIMRVYCYSKEEVRRV